MIAAMPTGANAYLFAQRYETAIPAVSGAVTLGTATGLGDDGGVVVIVMDGGVIEQALTRHSLRSAYRAQDRRNFPPDTCTVRNIFPVAKMLDLGATSECARSATSPDRDRVKRAGHFSREPSSRLRMKKAVECGGSYRADCLVRGVASTDTLIIRSFQITPGLTPACRS